MSRKGHGWRKPPLAGSFLFTRYELQNHRTTRSHRPPGVGRRLFRYRRDGPRCLATEACELAMSTTKDWSCRSNDDRVYAADARRSPVLAGAVSDRFAEYPPVKSPRVIHSFWRRGRCFRKLFALIKLAAASVRCGIPLQDERGSIYFLITTIYGSYLSMAVGGFQETDGRRFGAHQRSPVLACLRPRSAATSSTSISLHDAGYATVTGTSACTSSGANTRPCAGAAVSAPGRGRGRWGRQFSFGGG